MDVENICARSCTVEHRLQELVLIIPFGRQGGDHDCGAGTSQFRGEERDGAEIFRYLCRAFQVFKFRLGKFSELKIPKVNARSPLSSTRVTDRPPCSLRVTCKALAIAS